MDSVDCISNDTTHIESDECFKTNHDKKNMALPPKDQRHLSNTDIADFKGRLGKIYGRGVHQVQVFDFGGLTTEMAEGLSGRMLVEHRDAQGQSLFTIHAWRRLFEIRGPLLGGAKRRMSWREFTLAIGLHTAKEIEFAGFGILSKGDFLSSAPFYTAIRDPMLRLCHRLIVCSITGRSQAPEKEICFGEKPKAMTSGGQFVARLICDELGDTWASVASGLERQPVAAAGSPEVDEGAPDRLSRFEEEVHELRLISVGMRGVVDRSITRQSRYANWMISCMTQLMDASGHTYQAFDSTFVGISQILYQRRTRQRTGEASTSDHLNHNTGDDSSGLATFLRSSAKLNLSSSSNLLPSCALVKKNMISEFAEALTPL
ncbi:hypothetical protein Tco_0835312 [Tanacetum coccineum]